MLFIPKFYAHGYECLSKNCSVYYHLENYRDAKNEFGIQYNDKKLKIKWKQKSQFYQKDTSHLTFLILKKNINLYNFELKDLKYF